MLKVSNATSAAFNEKLRLLADKVNPKSTTMTQQELIEKQRKQQENIDWLNAKFSRPGAWSIGKELCETDAFVALGIRNANISPRQDDATLPTTGQLVQDPQDAEAYAPSKKPKQK